MGRSREDYERLHRPMSPWARESRLFDWNVSRIFAFAGVLIGTFVIVLDTWDWLETDIKIQNWSWPVAIMGLLVTWGIGAFIIWLSSVMIGSLPKGK